MRPALARQRGWPVSRRVGAVLDWVDRLLAPLHRSAASVSLTWLDALAMAMLWAIAAAYVWYGTAFFFNEVWARSFPRYTLPNGIQVSINDIYYDADIPRMIEILVGKNIQRIARLSIVIAAQAAHPLFLTIVRIPKEIILIFVGHPLIAIRLTTALLVPLIGPLVYLVVRGTGASCPIASLAAVCALSTGAFTHWAPVPETYAFAPATIAASFALLAVSSSRSAVVWVGVAALSGSITITNWAAGGLAVLARHPIRGAMRIILFSILTVAIFQAVEAVWIQHYNFMFSLHYISMLMGHVRFTTLAPFQNPMTKQIFNEFPFLFSDRLKNLLVFSGIVPEPYLRGTTSKTDGIWACLTFYDVPLSALGAVGGAAGLVWVALCGLGLWAALRSARRDVVFAVLGFLFFHLALHMAFGETAFLYVMHGLPSLASLVGFALTGPHSRLAVPLALVFIATAAPTNLLRFTKSAELANGLLLGTISTTTVSASGDF